MALQIRRGTDAERTAGGGVVFANGELVYVTDTDKLYIGDGATAGGMPMAGSAIASIGEYIVADTINSTLDLQQNLDLNGKDIIGTGNINIAGTITATGNINLGDDASADTVNLAAQITSSLTPNADATYDLGTTLLKWNNIHAVRLDGDVEGSVFGDDSTLLVDGVNNKIVGVVDTTSIRTSEDRIALGDSAGATNQDNGAVAIGSLTGTVDQGSQAVAVGVSAGRERQGYYATALGRYAGQNDQGVSAVAVGHSAARESQGVGAIAIGKLAGETNQAANSIVLNATGSAVENTTASSLVIKPVRDAVGTTVMMYNNANGEVTHTASPAFDLQGDLTGNVTGNVTGDVKGSGAQTVLAANTGPSDAALSVSTVTATTLSGTLTGNVTGNTAGYHTGDVKGSVFGDDSTVIVDAVNNTLIGNVTGDLTGNVTGDTAGTHTGAVVGNAAGDHTGTFTGNVFTALIDSADSSAITVTPAVVMSSDLTVDNAVSIGGITGVVINDNNISAYSASNPTKLAINSICADANDYTTELVIDSNVNVTNDMTVTGKFTAFGDRAITAIHRTALSETNSGFFVTEYAGSVTDAAELQDISNYTIKTKIVEDVADFGTAVKFASMTTSVRNALTPAAGMVVFNTTETKLQVYTGSAWADLH
jgi:hypothetical protein